MTGIQIIKFSLTIKSYVMTYYQFFQDRLQTQMTRLRYIGFYLVFLALLMFAISFIRENNFWWFHGSLFIGGWLTWTYGEYIVHRFWQHGKGVNKNLPSIKVHHHHHKHPNDIRITSKQRMLTGLVFLATAGLSLWLNNYFTLVSGIVFGGMYYTYMHVFLHQQWSKYLFPRLHRFHLYHHCKYPDHCHGISVIWWDLLFNTNPPEEKTIPERIRKFYYRTRSISPLKSAS